ncbi:MAG: arginine-ornithine antiporter [Carnobacterium sp.]|uniref:arginine-ornithine antiporter n=1 Tax=Carnobacterium sp. TaxID=48221 RepID=UPI003C737EC9
MEKSQKGISKIGLIALVISSSIGGGIFSITSDLAVSSAPGPAMIAWIIVGIGVLTLVLSLNNLAAKRPDLDSGIFGYAEATFGKLGGFISGWGYWLGAWLGNVAFATILMIALSTFFPIFGTGQNIPSIIMGSIVIWTLTLLVSKGMESASFINIIVTICKLVPLFVFLIITLVSFKAGVFTAHFWENVSTNLSQNNPDSASVFAQIKGCLIVMMWVFVGIEGASILANRAEKRSDAQQATIVGLLGLLFIYILASLLPYGVLSQTELASLSQPAMANILKAIVGDWGAAFINIGLIISIIGSWLSWTMLPAETVLLMARDGLLPKRWGRLNAKKAPIYSLVLTAALANLFLLTLLVTDYAYQLAYSLATSAILICYLLVGVYQMKYSYEQKDPKQFIIGSIATAFQLFAIVLAGFSYILMCSIAYIPGFYFYMKARKENDHPISKKEKITMSLIISMGVIAIVLMATGSIQV